MGSDQQFVNEDSAKELRIAERRRHLSSLYDSLPPSSAMPAFWLTIEHRELPLEVLVRVLRASIVRGDDRLRENLLVLLIQRVQATNERWAAYMLRNLTLHVDEYQIDLCADLRECLMRALLDPQRLFWEENFLRALYFARKHVYYTFMHREGWWSFDDHTGRRVPRLFVASLDQLRYYVNERTSTFDIEDEHAYQFLHSFESSDLLAHVVALSERLRAVVFLVYWEDRTVKDIAAILAIAERTVRYRLRVALRLLREALL